VWRFFLVLLLVLCRFIVGRRWWRRTRVLRCLFLLQLLLLLVMFLFDLLELLLLLLLDLLLFLLKLLLPGSIRILLL